MGDSSRIEELKRRVQMDPASIAFAALAEEYRRAGRYDEAIATCEAGLKRHPAYTSARVTLGRALLETGGFDEARTQLEHVLKVAPENLAAIRGLAEIHRRTREIPPPQDDGPISEPDPEAASGPEAPAVAELPAQPASPPVPLRVVPLSGTAPVPEAPPADAAPEASGSPEGADPDLVALPALEALLGAIVRVRSSWPLTDQSSSDPSRRIPAGRW